MQKLTTFVVALFISIAATAGNGNSISSIISKELKIPAELKHNKMNEKVNVQFKITESGKATVMKVETESPELRQYIMSQFPKMNFNPSSKDQEAVYFNDINFKVL